MRFIAAIALALLFAVGVSAQTSYNCTVSGASVHCIDPDTGATSDSTCNVYGNTVHCTTNDTTPDPRVAEGGYALGEGITNAIIAAVERHKAHKPPKKNTDWCIKNPQGVFPNSGLSCAEYMKTVGGKAYEQYLRAVGAKP